MTHCSHRTWVAVICLVLLLSTLAATPDASAGPLYGPDRASVTGIHFTTLHPANVIEATHADLMIRWKAGRPLTDGTVRITFPFGPAVTTLRPAYRVVGARETPGTFSVRPFGDIRPDPAVVPEPACDTLPDTTPEPFGVETDAAGDQVIVISHVTCAAGQSLTVLVEGVPAPGFVVFEGGPRADHMRLRITASDPVSPARSSVAALRVVQPPQVSLQIEVPAQVPAGGQFDATVTALRPDGATARHYQGSVALFSSDCTMHPEIDTVAARFTPADHGIITIPVVLSLTDNDEAHELQVYDIANKALPAVSNHFDVVGSVAVVDCPTSYH